MKIPSPETGFDAICRVEAGPSGRLPRVFALVVLLVMAGCGDLLYEDAAPSEPALLTLEYAPQLQGVDGADGSAAAFAAVDQAHVVLVSTSGGGGTVVDETFAVSPEGGEIRVQVEVDLEEAGPEFMATVVLRGGGSALFEGSSQVVMEPGATVQADLSLSPVPTALRISPEAPGALRALGETLQLSGQVVFATGDAIPGREVAWESADPGVASVSAAGEVTAVGPGSTAIRASHQNLSDQVEVEVDPEPATIEVEPAESEIGVGQTVQLSAVVRDGGGSRLDVEVEWTSSDETVASVNQSGLVTGEGEGTATIQARSGELTGTAQVEVEARLPTVETVGATAIGTTSARIRGNVNPSGLSTQVWFEWGRESDLSDATETDPTTLEGDLSTTLVGRDLRELEDGTTFYFRALAENDAGRATGDIRSFETSLLVPVPTNLQVEAYFGEGVVAEWSYDIERFPDATFELQMREAEPEETEWETVATTDETIAFLDTVLEADVTYQFRVRACRSGECSDWTASADLTLELPAPANLSVEQMDGLEANWDYDVENYPFVLFELEIRRAEPEEDWEFMGVTEQTWFRQFPPLTGDVTYEFRVRACDGSFCSGWSNVDQHTPGGVSPVVEARPAAEIEGGGATLRALVMDGGEEAEYWFEWGDNDDFVGWQTTPVRTVERTSLNESSEVDEDLEAFGFSETHRVEEFLTGLTPGEPYYYRAVVENTQGQYASGNTVSFTAGEEPEAPTEVTITQVDDGLSPAIQLDAQIISEPTPPDWMEAERRVDEGGWTFRVDGPPDLPYADGDVEEGSTYAYRLRVCWNQGGCSAWVLSDPESITVAAEEEGQPEALSPPGSGLRDTPW